jgi:hypothetical protein
MNAILVVGQDRRPILPRGLPFRNPKGVSLYRRLSIRIQTAPWLAPPVVPAITSSYELVRRLEDSRPSTFSIEIGNERTRVPRA